MTNQFLQIKNATPMLVSQTVAFSHDVQWRWSVISGQWPLANGRVGLVRSTLSRSAYCLVRHRAAAIPSFFQLVKAAFRFIIGSAQLLAVVTQGTLGGHVSG